jgi:type II secretory pathway pseudopilin PulG
VFRTRRHFLTLVELLLVLAILATAAGWVGMNIAKALREQRFRAEVASVVNQLRLAQDLCLSFQQNAIVRFTIAEGGTGIEEQLIFETPMPFLWNKELTRRKKLLTSIHFIDFQDEVRVPKEKPNSSEIKFLSGGSVVSRGIMRLSTSESKQFLGTLEQFICLPGYPTLIQSIPDLSEAEKCLQKDVSFDELLTKKTLEEIKL